MCGIFGITGHKDAARLTYFGLYALQHRGQESAGISAYDGAKTRYHVGMGLVPDVFTENVLTEGLPGFAAIGHTRYSTTGKPEVRNIQPFVVRMRGTILSLAHNGNLTNAVQIKKKLEAEGTIFQTSSDSEIFVHLIARAMSDKTLEEAILHAVDQVEGAYSLLILHKGKMIALRDPHGFHPLLLGKVPNNEKSWVFSSESCAFDLLEADYIRSVKPGEMIVIEPQGKEIKSYELKKKVPVKQCIFELVYFARPDSTIFDEDVFQCRKKMGAELVKEMPAEADIVIPFPDSGVYCAVGVSQASGVPYEHALIRNHYVGRTFIQPSQTMREFSVRVKINPVKSAINHKRLLVVDDSIVRGTTVRTRCTKLRELGAEEVHFRVSCPPIKYPCFYGIDFPSPNELVANKHSLDQLTRVLGLDSLHYLTLQGLKNCVKSPDDYCCACFDGNYPTPLPEHVDKLALEE